MTCGDFESDKVNWHQPKGEICYDVSGPGYLAGVYTGNVQAVHHGQQAVITETQTQLIHLLLHMLMFALVYVCVEPEV